MINNIIWLIRLNFTNKQLTSIFLTIFVLFFIICKILNYYQYTDTVIFLTLILYGCIQIYLQLLFFEDIKNTCRNNIPRANVINRIG